MGLYVEVDSRDFRELMNKFKAAGNTEFKHQLALFLEGIGDEFLRIVQDEIIRTETVDTRLLLNSFHKGGESNVWVMDEGNLSLEVGTNVKYAEYANKGHNTTPVGVEQRWVPGVWSGDRFIYTPGAKTGMLLKAKWVPGSHYWESALDILDRMIPHFLEKKVQEWIDQYFS